MSLSADVKGDFHANYRHSSSMVALKGSDITESSNYPKKIALQ